MRPIPLNTCFNINHTTRVAPQMQTHPPEPQQPTTPPSTTVVKVAVALRPAKDQHLDVELHIPSADQECPILQEPIATASFEFLQRPYDLSHPTHSALTLCKCSHTFHAMALVYYWARSGNVLCPVCRSGPVGQRLSIRRLPKEWKYSLAARIRRQRRIDRAEAEEDDHRVAVQLMASQQHIQHPILLTMRPMYLNICIEVLSELNARDMDTPVPLAWTVTTMPIVSSDLIVFDVPVEQLQHIPYPQGTRMRFVPRTNPLLQPLRPSKWFVAGVDQLADPSFSTFCDGTGFHHLHYSMSSTVYDTLVMDTFMAYDILMTVRVD